MTSKKEELWGGLGPGGGGPLGKKRAEVQDKSNKTWYLTETEGGGGFSIGLGKV